MVLSAKTWSASGSVVRPGEPMIEIVGKHRFVVARFPVSRLYRLQVGDAVTVSTGGAGLPGKIVKVSVIADALPKEFQKALATIDGTRQIASVRPAQGFTAGAQVVGKAVSGRCFAFWNAVLSAEPREPAINENSCGRRSRLNSRGFARRPKETHARRGHIGGLKLRSDDGSRREPSGY